MKFTIEVEKNQFNEVAASLEKLNDSITEIKEAVVPKANGSSTETVQLSTEESSRGSLMVGYTKFISCATRDRLDTVNAPGFKATYYVPKLEFFNHEDYTTVDMLIQAPVYKKIIVEGGAELDTSYELTLDFGGIPATDSAFTVESTEWDEIPAQAAEIPIIDNTTDIYKYFSFTVKRLKKLDSCFIEYNGCFKSKIDFFKI